MPIYEYICNKCNTRTEKLEKINEKNETICPSCKENSLKKIISISNFNLKGSGWYKTDYKKNKE